MIKIAKTYMSNKNYKKIIKLISELKKLLFLKIILILDACYVKK